MADEPTKDELLERAGELDISGRHDLDKEELQAAIDAAEAEEQESASADEDEQPDVFTAGDDREEATGADGVTVRPTSINRRLS